MKRSASVVVIRSSAAGPLFLAVGLKASNDWIAILGAGSRSIGVLSTAALLASLLRATSER